MEEYIDGARYASKSDDELLFAYDHEKANNDQYFDDGVRKGIEQCIEQGKEETTIELIKSFYSNGISIEAIAKSTKISIEKVKEILELK